MSCKKNKKRWLFFTWFGEHDFKLVRFGRFLRYGSNFVVYKQCRYCRVEVKDYFVNEDDLLDMGVTIEEIEAARDRVID